MFCPLWLSAKNTPLAERRRSRPPVRPPPGRSSLAPLPWASLTRRWRTPRRSRSSRRHLLWSARRRGAARRACWRCGSGGGTHAVLRALSSSRARMILGAARRAEARGDGSASLVLMSAAAMRGAAVRRRAPRPRGARRAAPAARRVAAARARWAAVARERGAHLHGAPPPGARCRARRGARGPTTLRSCRRARAVLRAVLREASRAGRRTCSLGCACGGCLGRAGGAAISKPFARVRTRYSATSTTGDAGRPVERLASGVLHPRTDSCCRATVRRDRRVEDVSCALWRAIWRSWCGTTPRLRGAPRRCLLRHPARAPPHLASRAALRSRMRRSWRSRALSG